MKAMAAQAMVGFGLLATILSGSRSMAMEADAREELQIFNSYRYLNQTNLSPFASSLDWFLMGSADLRARDSGFQLAAEPQLRGLVGRAAEVPPTDPAFLTVQSPPRLLTLGTRIGSSADSEWYFDCEKLDLSYANESTEAYVGRRPVSLGVLKIFPVWNKFTRPLPVTPGPVLIFGSDGAGFRYQVGEVNFRVFSILGQTSADDVYVGEVTWYSSFGEYHVLASSWFQEAVVGVAFAKDLGGTTFRGEFLGIGLRPQDLERAVQAGLGDEYAFNADWSGIAEVFLQSDGKTNPAEYTVYTNNRFSPFRALGYSFLLLTYNASAIWSFSGGGLTNLVDLSNYLVLRAKDSLANEADLFFEGDIPLGTSGSEFSSQTFNFGGGATLGAPFQFSAGVKAYF